jgi:hypothetical protein
VIIGGIRTWKYSASMKVGIIGEDPYDTTAIKNLLSRKYPYQFKPILKQVRGHQLDSAKSRRLLKIELMDNAYPVIIYNRDLDGLETETQKKEKVFNWFKKMDSLNTNIGILLLNIYELEALILADIDTFNRLFGTRVNFTGNPMYKKEPKEYLKEQTRKCRRKYDVSENPAIFKLLRTEEWIKNCLYFKEFIIIFDKKIKEK